MNRTIFLLGFLYFFNQTGSAGTSDQDPIIKKLRQQFESAETDLKLPMLQLGKVWSCHYRSGLKDDFYYSTNTYAYCFELRHTCCGKPGRMFNTAAYNYELNYLLQKDKTILLTDSLPPMAHETIYFRYLSETNQLILEHTIGESHRPSTAIETAITPSQDQIYSTNYTICNILDE